MGKVVLASLLAAGLLLTGGPTRGDVTISDITLASETCSSPSPGGPVYNGVVDPDETIAATATFTNTGAAPTIYATVKFYGNDNVLPLLQPEPLGALAPGASTVRTFAFVARGACGQPFSLSFGIFDGDASLGSASFPLRLGAPRTTTATIGQPNDVAFASSGVATPYPSTISVSGITGEVEAVGVSMLGLNHTNPDDIDLLLVAPGGQKILLMSDAGGATDADGVDLVFLAGAAADLPDNGPLVTGTFRPTNYGAVDAFSAPAPTGPYSTDLGTLAGIDPNGTWRLYAMDDAGGGSGSIEAWGVTIRYTTYECCTSETKAAFLPWGAELVAENCAPGNGAIDPHETVSMRLSFRNLGNADATSVTSEVLPGPRVQPLSGARASGPVVVGATDAVTHSVIIRAPAGSEVPLRVAFRDGESDLGTLAYNVTLGVPAYRNLDRLEFADPDPITVTALGSATPYPASLTVTNVTGPVERVQVQLSGVTHPNPDDLDILLVGPTGRKVLLMSDAGGAYDMDSVSLTFDDNAADPLPDAAPISGGAYRPTNYGAADTFAAPAPAGPYASALAEFAGASPNGTWKLFVTDDALNNAGSIAGWKLTLQCEGKTYEYTGGPATLYDHNTVERPITVDDYGYVGGLLVTVRANHTYDADLDMSLIGPNGFELPLLRDRGGAGNNLGSGSNDCMGTSTMFTDHAARAISEGAAPFTGSYRPESPLSAFDGRPMHGDWKLRIYDDEIGNTGALGCWKIQPSRCPSLEVVKNAAIVIPQKGPATPFPSVLPVSGVFGRVVGVSVRLTGVTHARPDDLDVMLVGPEGQAVVLVSDAGADFGLVNADYLFVERADNQPPDNSRMVSGVYRPVDHCGEDDILGPSDRCGKPLPTDLSAFRGTDPNGAWCLLVSDDADGNAGSITGWSLTLHTMEYAQCGGMAFTPPDVQWAAGLASGLIEGNPSSVDRLDVVHGASDDKVDMSDVGRLRRKVSGTDPNP